MALAKFPRYQILRDLRVKILNRLTKIISNLHPFPHKFQNFNIRIKIKKIILPLCALVSAQDNKGGVSLDLGATFRSGFANSKAAYKRCRCFSNLTMMDLRRVLARRAPREAIAMEARRSYLCRFGYKFCLSSPLTTKYFLKR